MNPNDWLARLPSPLATAKTDEPRQWYRIEPRAQASGGSDDATVDEVDVFVYGVIGGWWSGVDAKTFIKAVQGIDAKQLNIHISSVGGSVFEGLAIFQALRNHPARIVTYVDALAASSASIIAMAGDLRVVAPYASVMVHRAWNFVIGNDIELHKYADEIGRLTKNMARVYANRSTSDATVDEWLDVMTEETWYYGEEAVEAGLMHEVQEDAEKTGDGGGHPAVVPDDDYDDEDDDDDEVAKMNRFAMAFFGFTGRDRSTPPRMPKASPVEPAPLADHAAQTAPKVSGAEPEPDNRTEEDILSTELSDISSRLGLPDDVDTDAISAAIDDLKAKADTPTEPRPDPEARAEAERMAALNEDLSQKVAMLAEQVQAMGSQLAAVNAEKAAATKVSVIQAAAGKGKFTQAERTTWEARYDRAPEVTTEVLATIPDFTAVPMAMVGEIGPDEPSGEAFSDHEYDRLFGEKASA